MLDKITILSINDIATEIVDVPEWGGQVTIRALSAKNREIMRESVTGEDGEVDITALKVKLIIMSAIDKDGNRLFEQNDFNGLSNKCATAIERLFVVAQRLSKLTNKDLFAK
jgi:hypothetical protein